MMTSLTYSQKLSNDTIRCVPVSTLRHALLIKAQNDQCQEVVKNCRDSITILTKIVNNQDTLIKIKTEKVVLYEKNQSLYDETLKNIYFLFQDVVTNNILTPTTNSYIFDTLLGFCNSI